LSVLNYTFYHCCYCKYNILDFDMYFYK